MKRRKALLSERVIRDKVRKASKRASETRKRLCTGKNRTEHMIHVISINTYHLACAEGSALQCCSFSLEKGGVRIIRWFELLDSSRIMQTNQNS